MFGFLPTREGSVHSHATTVSRVLSTEHNKSAVFLSESSTLQLISGYSPKEAPAMKASFRREHSW